MGEFSKVEKPIAVDVYAYRGAVGPGPSATREGGLYDLMESFRTEDAITNDVAPGWTYDAAYHRYTAALTTGGATKSFSVEFPQEIPDDTRVRFVVEVPRFTAGSLLLRYTGITLKTWVPADVQNGLLTFDYTTLSANEFLTLRLPASTAIDIQVASVAVKVGIGGRAAFAAANTGSLDAAVPVRVPSVWNMLDTDATDVLEAAGFTVTPTTDNDEDIAVDHVISQDPGENELADAASAVAIVVSLGPA